MKKEIILMLDGNVPCEDETMTGAIELDGCTKMTTKV